MIQASAPGKLYIAGEYAVLEPGHPAILVALDQFITVKLKKAHGQGTIRSSLSNGFPIPWTRKEGTLYIDQRENPFAYVVEALTVTENYLSELGHELVFFDLDIESDLDNHDGRKYGLGSSGAVTVATIKALLKFYRINYSQELVYKLAALAHLSINSNGSFGDLAASSFGGWIAYSCFDREAVEKMSHKLSLIELLASDWPQLMIESLTPPSNLKLLTGWTGSPASTTHLVDALNEERADIKVVFQAFLKASKQCVDTMIAAFALGDLEMIQKQIRKNRTLLQKLGASSGVQIETLTLFELCEIATTYDGAAKSSGAGGGDCGICIIDKNKATDELIKEWQAAGIQQLPLNVHYETAPEYLY